MAKNVLIFFPRRLKASFGGAYSYLFQLRKAFPANSKVKLHFLSDLVPIDDGPEAVVNRPAPFKELVKKMMPDRLIYSRRIRHYLEEIVREPVLQRAKAIDVSVYDAIHFHETVDLWRCVDLLKTYKGKVILTSHSPLPYHLELLEDVFHLQKENITIKDYRKLEEIDIVAFARADVILSPCNEAMDAYRERWPVFNDIIAGKPEMFIPTGIDAVPVTRTAQETRAEYGIAEDAFVVCFNGRHHRVKGYDLLTEAAVRLLPENPRLWFFVTGRNDEPAKVRHERWIETGWTSEPQNYLSAADLVVVPNRETYFDLNVLTALSLGKPLALSRVGGNRHFERFSCKGILFFDEMNAEAITLTIAEACRNKDALAAQSEALKKLFQQEFSLSRFADQYQQFYLSV